MLTRRILLAGVSALVASAAKAPDKPALLGGKPIRTERGRRWPIINKKDESGWLDVLRSKQWNRRGGTAVAEFERSWADKLGAKHAIATNGGSTALLAGLYALDIGPGDEVIVPPYTFIASVNSVLLRHALPVFVDTDRATLQIDASKIEAAITVSTSGGNQSPPGAKPYADAINVKECATVKAVTIGTSALNRRNGMTRQRRKSR